MFSFLLLFSLLSINRPDGTRFIAQKENCVLPRRAVRGDVVTFTHDFASRQLALAEDETQEVHALRRRETQDSQSVPSNAVVYRIRNDVLWKDVVLSSDSPIRHFLNGAFIDYFFIFLYIYLFILLFPSFFF